MPPWNTAVRTTKIKYTCLELTLAYKDQPAIKHIANELLAEFFDYDKLRTTAILKKAGYLFPTSEIKGAVFANSEGTVIDHNNK